jgi:hypothetical protein
MSIEQRQKELNELESRAHSHLINAENLEPTEMVQQLLTVCRLWNYPSFKVHKSWTVFMPPSSESRSDITFAREVTWNRPEDLERLSDPLIGLKKGFDLNPSIEVKDAIVNLKDFYLELDKLNSINIPVVPKSEVFGLDGEIRGFHHCLPNKEIKLQWWFDGPIEWKDLTCWQTEMQEFLERHFRSWE